MLGVSGAGAVLLQEDKRAVDHPLFTQKNLTAIRLYKYSTIEEYTLSLYVHYLFLCTPIINLLFFLLQILHPDS